LPVEAARAVPILEVLSRYGVECRRTGREALGRCPFGDHRHLHLYVNPAKGLWKCWPCDLGGDAIAFVMRLKGLDFGAAVREVAA
jgi:DNA primase